MEDQSHHFLVYLVQLGILDELYQPTLEGEEEGGHLVARMKVIVYDEVGFLRFLPFHEVPCKGQDIKCSHADAGSTVKYVVEAGLAVLLAVHEEPQRIVPPLGQQAAPE